MDPLFGPEGNDPLLDFQPNFALSLPVQILLLGVILTLVAVLLIHLLFTAHTHWPLARLNYALQISGVITLLTSLIASIIAVFHLLHGYSRGWPYMLDYIAISIPPDHWTTVEKISWYSMEAITSGLAHTTNIQTLTLLFPTKIEQKLIFFLLGPLVLASSATTFASLSPTPHAKDLGDAIRGICNTTLSLLFTSALFIWGFIINPKEAWRTDGGTAVFGAGASLLAVMSTVVNLILIFEDRLVWLPYMNWAVVLWQSFFGWWWFAGSGMGIPEVEDMLYRAERNKRKALEKERKRKGKKRSEVQPPTSSASGVLRFLSPLVGTLGRQNFTRTVDSDHDTTTGHTGNRETLSVHSELPPRGQLQKPRSGISNLVNERAAVERAQTDLRSEGGETESWALGAYGLVQREEAERRIREFKERRKTQRLLSQERYVENEEREEDWEDEYGEHEQRDALERLQREVDAEAASPSVTRRRGNRSPSHSPSRSAVTSLPDPLPPSGSIFWLWGPLRRWRLQDRTVYQ
ncbi:uncharacterized protein EI90DRAFT_3149971 [Cantharellus anzutake]|uniref:uncharacterized protein n=1 Tax=Cantharellus anzutake TaxID=1750568 RepID=UPI001904F993|nr:uncharacterized protein EI90DRAFT_3149971 [Cantharellus anzutake]KAF8342947.1 hypothetical protein EI90DRAFT_3149971 [Cantharellus anzutake]